MPIVMYTAYNSFAFGPYGRRPKGWLYLLRLVEPITPLTTFIYLPSQPAKVEHYYIFTAKIGRNLDSVNASDEI